MPDELNDLYDYDIADDQLPDIQQSNAAGPLPLDSAESGQADVLGIDEEVQVTKQRKPIAKLDEERLLSDAGIPKLRRIAKKRMKFKGKGHEYSDVTRLLNIYQLWLDDLYPRAKFADGLAIIEKKGHSKVMQRQRLEWISEDKPERADHHTLDNEEAPILEAQHDLPANEVPATALRSADVTMEDAASSLEKDNHIFVTLDQGQKNTPEDDEPPEDELDALLAETANVDREKSSASNGLMEVRSEKQMPRDEFEDEMEAMAEFDDL